MVFGHLVEMFERKASDPAEAGSSYGEKRKCKSAGQAGKEMLQDQSATKNGEC